MSASPRSPRWAHTAFIALPPVLLALDLIRTEVIGSILSTPRAIYFGLALVSVVVAVGLALAQKMSWTYRFVLSLIFTFVGLMIIPPTTCRSNPEALYPSRSALLSVATAHKMYAIDHNGIDPPLERWEVAIEPYKGKGGDIDASTRGRPTLNRFQSILTAQVGDDCILFYLSSQTAPNPVGFGLDAKWFKGRTFAVLGNGTVKAASHASELAHLPWFPANKPAWIRACSKANSFGSGTALVSSPVVPAKTP